MTRVPFKKELFESKDFPPVAAREDVAAWQEGTRKRAEGLGWRHVITMDSFYPDGSAKAWVSGFRPGTRLPTDPRPRP